MADEKKKIIVVDDNPENLNVLKNILKSAYEVYSSPSALNMFKLLEHIQPDLILLDIEMPEMNGYSAARKLKDSGKYTEIPIMFLTSRSDAHSEIEGLAIGAVDYIHKPFVAPLLHQRIKTYLTLIEHEKQIKSMLELKTKEVVLREAAELEAQNASRAKGEFLSHMSHEIRSPLNAVIGMINIAAEEDDIQKIKKYLEKAGSASKHVLGVINDILDMSKIEANKLELSVAELDFGKMIGDIVDVISFRAKEKNQDTVVNINQNIPQFIVGDELRLSQVITNLLTNAIKFTPNGGKVELNAEKLDSAPSSDDKSSANDEITLRIEVADNGIGISPEQKKKLFTSYNQADSSITKQFGGTGLGLAISKRIVELMQGRIWIESELEHGAKFIFTIKVKKGQENAGKSSTAGTKSANYDFKGYTILAAEDMEFNREILAKYLLKTGISIDFAENGKEAVYMFSENPGKYNLILTDIHMPEMDGDTASRAIRSLDLPLAKTIPIIAMTADAFKEDIEKYLSAGMTDYVVKPIVPKNIYAVIKKYLG
ncbi:MAG: response regulator [Treponema sp.]|jgi:signal transduction histidine kinase|nr:response regulator [Treponema sp.]